MEILLKAKGGSNSNSNRKLYQQFLDGEKVAPNKRRGQKKFFLERFYTTFRISEDKSSSWIYE
jgi:hypothetical protein